MKILVAISLICTFLLTSCESEKDTDILNPLAGSVSGRFYLTTADYDNVEHTRVTVTNLTVKYDEISYYVVDLSVNRFVSDVKTEWRPEISELIVEGLQEGRYQLLVLAVQGDTKADRATIHPLTTPMDAWLSFPEDQAIPLQADYYYGRVEFSVEVQQGVETITPLQEVSLRRLIGGIEFNFTYNNPYVRTSLEKNTLLLEEAKFYTTFTADQRYEGESIGGIRKVELERDSRILRFMPSIHGSSPLQGKIEMHSRNYKGKEIIRNYNFSDQILERGRLNRVNTQVIHPDDNNGVLYMTPAAFEDSRHGYILQDDEPKEVYTDSRQRKFITTKPLQTEITDNGELHLRFYSPRPLKDVTVSVNIPSAHERIILAYLDSIPAFADIWLEIPATQRSMTFPTASGGHITLPPLTVDELRSGELTIESGEDYWTRLQKIKIPWTIFFGLFGGNPDRPNGGPVGNWIGIRPLHCRETVAFMLNVTYMFGLEDVVQLMRDNADKLLGNDGKTPEPIDRVVSKMRGAYSLQVGLVNHNTILGLGSPSVWGVVQDCHLFHYDNSYLVHVSFHELGHVMNYNHSSSFTYGIWAERLMNNFYINHINEFPIDKYTYLNSRNNPNKY